MAGNEEDVEMTEAPPTAPAAAAQAGPELGVGAAAATAGAAEERRAPELPWCDLLVVFYARFFYFSLLMTLIQGGEISTSGVARYCGQ